MTSPLQPQTIWISMSDPNSHVLLEDGGDLLMEDGVGFILLEFNPPATAWTRMSDPSYPPPQGFIDPPVFPPAEGTID